jgi:O-antigen/teichoic acid export membrane protein
VGVAAIFASIVGLVGLMGCFTYELAIMLPKSDKEAANVFALCCTLVAAVTFFTALLTGLFGSSLLALLGAAELEPFKWLIPIGVFFFALTLPFTYWNTRHKQFKRIALVNVEAVVVNTIIVLTIGFLGFTTGTNMVSARLCGIAATPVFLGWSLWRNDLTFILRTFSTEKMLGLARRYKKFPLITSWNVLLNQASREMPTILLAGFFGVGIAGLYSLAKRLVSLPSQLLSQAVGHVFFQRSAAAHANEEGDLPWLFENVVKRLISIGLLPMLFITMTGPVLFRFALGERWTNAGTYAAILAVWLSFMFVASPLTVLYNVLERQGMYLVYNVVLIAFRMAALIIGGLVFRNIIWSLALYCLVGLSFNLFSIFLLTFFVKARFTVIIGAFLRCYIYLIPTVVIFALFKWVIEVPPILFLLISAFAFVPYAVLVLRRDEELRALFLGFLRRLPVFRKQIHVI